MQDRMKFGGVALRVLFVAVFAVVLSLGAQATYQAVGWKYSSGDLQGSRCIQSAVDNIDGRLDIVETGADTTYYIWVSLEGSDSTGTGTRINPYALPSAALAQVTSTRKTVILEPGTYTESSQIDWPQVTDVLITGISPDVDSTMIRCSDTSNAVIDIAPVTAMAQANFLAFFANLVVSGNDGCDGVKIDDTGMTNSYKLIVTFRDCAFGADDDSDKSIDGTSTVTANKTKIYMHGRGFGGNTIEGLVYIDPENAGDRYVFNGMKFEGGVQFGTSTKASETEFYNCIMKLSGGSGGQDTQILRANNCISRDGMTHAAAVLGDFADNAEEAFLGID